MHVPGISWAAHLFHFFHCELISTINEPLDGHVSRISPKLALCFHAPLYSSLYPEQHDLQMCTMTACYAHIKRCL